ncbi:MAG: serine/threonine-protein kinase [Oligosphaeraceae bacterium]
MTAPLESTRTLRPAVEETQFSSGEPSPRLTNTRIRRIRERFHARMHGSRTQWRPFSPLPGDVPHNLVPGCTLQAVIGSGGMGTVYLARQNALNRQVAVKVLNPRLANDPVFMERLRKEAQIMGTFSHPNLVGCHDIIVSRNGACILMEYIPGHLNGRNLVQLLGPMPERYAIPVLHAVAKGLAYAYEKGFTHRDVKPDNLLFAFQDKRPPESYEELFQSPDFRVALCDFGIASTQNQFPEEHGGEDAPREEPAPEPRTEEDEEENAIVGSPLYMSPEQAIMPEDVDCRSDIYSLACTAFFLLTGKPPFPGKTLEEVLDLKTQCDLPLPVPPPPAKPLNPVLGKALLRMGALQQEDRFQDYATLLDILSTLETSLVSPLSFRLFTYHYRKFLIRLCLGALLLGGVILLGLFGYTQWLNNYERRLMDDTVFLGKWEGTLSTWQQIFTAEGRVLLGTPSSGPLTLKERLRPGDYLRVSLNFQDVGSAVLMLHMTMGEETIPLVRIICYRESRRNVVQLGIPSRRPDSTTSFEEIPGPLDLPDATNPWIQLRLQFHESFCVVWNQERPLGICHFPPGMTPVQEAAFSISRLNCPQVQFANIALVKEKYAQRILPRLNEEYP